MATRVGPASEVEDRQTDLTWAEGSGVGGVDGKPATDRGTMAPCDPDLCKEEFLMGSSEASSPITWREQSSHIPR